MVFYLYPSRWSGTSVASDMQSFSRQSQVFSAVGLVIFRLLVTSGGAVYHRFVGASYPQVDILDQETDTLDTLGQQTIILDLRCISWMLQTSLDKAVRVSTLRHLATMTALPNFDPTIVADCFNAFVGCFNVNDRGVVVVQGLEELATVSTLCLFNTICHLLASDPSSRVLEDVQQRYSEDFPVCARFHCHQFHHTLNAIHDLFTGYKGAQWWPRSFRWTAYEPPIHEHTIIAHNLVTVALIGYQRTRQAKVPRWILRFALHSLSLDPLPPMSIITDCLSIIAIDLGCDVSDMGTVASGKRWVHI